MTPISQSDVLMSRFLFFLLQWVCCLYSPTRKREYASNELSLQKQFQRITKNGSSSACTVLMQGHVRNMLLKGQYDAPRILSSSVYGDLLNCMHIHRRMCIQVRRRGTQILAHTPLQYLNHLWIASTLSQPRLPVVVGYHTKLRHTTVYWYKCGHSTPNSTIKYLSGGRPPFNSMTRQIDQFLNIFRGWCLVL